MQELNTVENTILGGCTAFVIGVTLQPTLYWKNAAQQGKPFTLNPRILYRGLGAALLAEVGQMALQFALTGRVKNLILRGDIHRPMTPTGLIVTIISINSTEEMASAVIGGAISAVYTSPVELTMIQQQNFGGTLVGTVSKIIKEKSVLALSRGLMATSSRDAVYTCGLLGITPVVQNYISNTYGYNQSLAGFWASIIGGTICGALSCPLDVVKTCMQGDLNQNVHTTFSKTFYAQRNRLFSGVTFRCANLIGTIMIANEFRGRVAPLLFPGKFLPEH